MFLTRGELMLNSPKGGGVVRGRLSSADTTISSSTSAASAGHLNEEDLGKFRTKFCERKIIYGYCDHGGGWGCNFSHNLKWLRRNAQKQKYAPRMCANFPSCVNGMSCQYAHSREEQFFHPSVYKRLPCLTYSHGCRLGQLCPFTHGISDHCLVLSSSLNNPQLSHEDLYQLVDQQTSVILHTLNLTAEKLFQAVADLELEHDPGVRMLGSSSSSFHRHAHGRSGSGSLLDVLHEIANPTTTSISISSMISTSSTENTTATDTPISDRFLSLLKGERGFCLPQLLCSGDENAASTSPGAVKGQQPQMATATTASNCWKAICKDITILVSSGKVGTYLGGQCVVFQGRMETCASSSGGYSGAFVLLEDKTASFRECLVVRCSVKPPQQTSSGGGLVSPVRVETDAKNGWVGIFEVDGRRTLLDWLKLERKVLSSSAAASGGWGGKGGAWEERYLLEDYEGQLGMNLEDIGEFLTAMKEDRELLIRQYIVQMLKIVQTVHEGGNSLGGFTLDQWQFASGSVEKLLLLPVHSNGGSGGGVVEDVRSVGLTVAQLLLSSVDGLEMGNAVNWLGSVAEQRGGLAWDFVVRCIYRGDKETMAELLSHPFLWSWSTLGSVLMRGVSTWFQQSGLLFKPNAQRHLINWAENSFGCTRNEGVPARRQVFRLAATLDWTPPSRAAAPATNVVATMNVGDKRASPCLVLESGKVSLVKCPMSSRGKDAASLLGMLPVCSADSHLELILPKQQTSAAGKGRSQLYNKVIEQLLSRFHLTERTSVYSFLSFVLFALANPHLCMDADVINKNSQAALIRRHRAVVNAILNAVPLGILMTCQLAEADNLLDPLLAGAGYTSPKRVRSPTTLLLDGRFLN